MKRFSEIATPSPPLLEGGGATVRIGALSVALKIPQAESELISDLSHLYAEFPQSPPADLADFEVVLAYATWWDRFRRRHIRASVEGVPASPPTPVHLGVPLLESTLNWYIGTEINRFLLVHAGVVERAGLAVLLPGSSGSGKSTLSAVLALRGWRLLSDEIAMIRPGDGVVLPHPRPITLKNESIEIVGKCLSTSRFRKSYEGTIRGTVAYIQPPTEAVVRALETARPAAIVFPRFSRDEPTIIRSIERSVAFRRLVDCTPNYLLLMERGFEAFANLVEACGLYTLSYRDIDEAVGLIKSLDLGAGGRGLRK